MRCCLSIPTLTLALFAQVCGLQGNAMAETSELMKDGREMAGEADSDNSVAAPDQHQGYAPLTSDRPAVGTWLDRLLEFDPTGDTLYDLYQKALLTELAKPLPVGRNLSESCAVPDNVMAQWEGQFGSDPRYWQLRLFELQCASLPAEERDRQSDLLLSQWQKQAGHDPVLGYLQFRVAKLKLSDLPILERERSETDLFTSFAAGYPEESLPQYEAALQLFRRGEWDSAMIALARGNAAEDNSGLDPFPLSFLQQRLRRGQLIGNEAVAGHVLEGAFSAAWGLANSIRVNDVGKEFQVRGNLGAGLSDASAFSQFLCRRAMMDNSGMSEAMTSATIAKGLVSYLLTDCAEAFDPDQRKALLLLYSNWDRVFDVYKEMKDDRPRRDSLMTEALAAQDLAVADLAEYILQGDPAMRLEPEVERLSELAKKAGRPGPDSAKVETRLRRDKIYRLDLCLRALNLQYYTADARFEYFDEGQRLQPILERSAAFDWQFVSLLPRAAEVPQALP